MLFSLTQTPFGDYFFSIFCFKQIQVKQVLQNPLEDFETELNLVVELFEAKLGT